MTTSCLKGEELRVSRLASAHNSLPLSREYLITCLPSYVMLSGVFPCLPIAPFTVHVFVLSPAVQWTYTSCFNPYIINDIDHARGRFYHSKRISHTNKDISMRWIAALIGVAAPRPRTSTALLSYDTR